MATRFYGTLVKRRGCLLIRDAGGKSVSLWPKKNIIKYVQPGHANLWYLMEPQPMSYGLLASIVSYVHCGRSSRGTESEADPKG
jgi:hypothetical protein